MLTVGSLFSGIGGLDLGLERAGMSVRWQCEIDPYCRAVLAHHWPGVPCYEDIRDIDGTAERVDLVCGGFPCQPVSDAGQRKAQEDPRWLWPEFARVVGDLRPRYVLVENVPGLVKRGLDLVVTGLAEMGYDAEWEIVSAAACGAPHLRERLIIVAHNAGIGLEERGLSGVREEARLPDAAGSGGVRLGAGAQGDPGSARLADADSIGCDGRARYFTEANWWDQSPNGSWWATEPGVGRVAHGIPHVVDRLRSLGNAVVPQVAEAVGRMILAAE